MFKNKQSFSAKQQSCSAKQLATARCSANNLCFSANRKVSLIFPAYNEEENIRNAILDFKSLNIFDEILVINNNSKDKTAEIAGESGATVINELTQGYGASITRGLKEANGDYLVLCEPDGTFKAADTLKLLPHLNDFDMVTGSRTNLHFIEKGANMGPLLRWGNISLAKLIQLLFGPKLTDCGCTFRVMRRSLIIKILPFLTVKWSHFLSQLVILTALSNHSILEMPVHYQKRVGVSKITGSFKRALLVGIRMLSLTLKYRLIGKAVFKKSPEGN